MRIVTEIVWQVSDGYPLGVVLSKIEQVIEAGLRAQPNTIPRVQEGDVINAHGHRNHA